MNSTLDNSTLNPDAGLSARADERLAHAYEQIALADDQLARVTERLAKMEHDTAQHPAALGGARLSRGRSALRGFLGLVLAGCIGAAAFASQSPYGEAARPMIAQWAPHLLSPVWSEKPAGSAASPAPVQLAAAEPTFVQPTASAQAPQDAASTPAPTSPPASPDLAQVLEGMARDIAAVEWRIEELKASQERMAADTATAIEQLKASQEEMARLVAATPSAPDPRAKTPVPLPRPVATAARKPPPAQPAQARARPQPVQLQPREQ